MRKCPACGVSMRETSVGPVQVDECPQCRGLWFQDDELRLAKDATDPDLRWLDVDLWKHAERFSVDPHHLVCPDCAGLLVAVRYGDTDVNIHCCPTSRGIWLDRSEFAKLIDALEAEVVTLSEADYIKASLRQAKDVVTGPESFISEWRDLKSVLHLLHHRFFVEHQGLANFLRNVPRLP